MTGAVEYYVLSRREASATSVATVVAVCWITVDPREVPCEGGRHVPHHVPHDDYVLDRVAVRYVESCNATSCNDKIQYLNLVPRKKKTTAREHQKKKRFLSNKQVIKG